MESPIVILFVLHIAGAAALLIWSVRMVRTGAERAFQMQLNRLMKRAGSNRLYSGMMGTIAAVILQSSTAVALLISGFVATGSVAVLGGIAILLGADIGSAIAANILLVRQPLLVPILLVVGVVLFQRARQRQLQQAGRILLGLGLIFVSLDMIRAATAPMIDSPGATVVMQYLGQDVLTAFIVGAGFAWAVQSSVAAILLVVTLVAQGLLPGSAAAAMVLGANLGGTFVAYTLTLSAPVAARQMILSNLILRGGGAVLTLLGFGLFGISLTWIGGTEAAQIIHLHLLFNLGVAAAGLPTLGIVSRIALMFLPAGGDPDDLNGPVSALDNATLAAPDRALTCAAREIVHMGETIETMLRSVNLLYQKWDDATATAITTHGKRARKMHHDVKLFLAKLNQGLPDEASSRRSMELSVIAANLEVAADTIVRNMLKLARRIDQEGLAFSKQGWIEICDFHDHVLANVQLALNVLMTQDIASARELIREKDEIRGLERTLQLAHLSRLQQGLAESIQTSNIHQETLRTLKQVNSAFAMIAQPILSDTGDLLDSRLTSDQLDQGLAN